MAARFLTGTKKFAHITLVLKSLHWLLVKKRIDFKVLLLVYYALNDQATESFRDMLKERANVLILCSKVSSQLSVPREQAQRLWGSCFNTGVLRL